MAQDPRTILAEGLRADFIEFVEGDDDICSVLMDKLSVFCDEKLQGCDEELRYDVALQILSSVGIR